MAMRRSRKISGLAGRLCSVPAWCWPGSSFPRMPLAGTSRTAAERTALRPLRNFGDPRRSIFELHANGVDRCLSNVANLVYDRFVPQRGPELALCLGTLPIRESLYFDLEVPQIDRHSARMTVLRLQFSGRYLRLEYPYVFVIEQKLMRVGRDLHRVQIRVEDTLDLVYLFQLHDDGVNGGFPYVFNGVHAGIAPHRLARLARLTRHDTVRKSRIFDFNIREE